ncbi:MAG TPA: hypothetical protein VG253_00415 [Streptosporangiaceae bacterium]|nr:hypothetical protein [Streptosporangiaceae bacterium]
MIAAPDERQRELLAQSYHDGQLARLRALRKAARRADRAERKLVQARNQARRLRGELDLMA